MKPVSYTHLDVYKRQQLACEKMFKHPQVMYFGSFESVFSAIENGFCDYGVLPLENSTAGSVKQIYDLMLRHSSFKIVRSTRLKVDHNLVAKKGTKLEDIKEICSHPQAISQCTAFLEKLGKDVKAVSYTHLDVYKRQGIYR